MPLAYLIVDTKITNEDKYEEYKRLAAPLLEECGGEYLARGGTLVVDQDELWTPNRLVVVKFPSMQHAKDFLKNDKYQPIKAIRIGASQATLTIVEGI